MFGHSNMCFTNWMIYTEDNIRTMNGWDEPAEATTIQHSIESRQHSFNELNLCSVSIINTETHFP